MFDRTLTPSDVLDGATDVEALLAVYPKHFTVKGMFCARIVDMLGQAGWQELAPKLQAAPRGSSYVAFKDYPQTDYTRLVMFTAVRLFPELSTTEAARRVARDDFAAFARSNIGKVMVALVGDARTALMHLPEAYARIIGGISLRADELDVRTVRISCDNYYGVYAYFLGQLEGIVLSMGGKPRIYGRKLDAHTMQFDVNHG